MPPKKAEAEIDVSLLPSYNPIVGGFSLSFKKSRADKFIEKFKQKAPFYIKIISRQDIIDFANEKAKENEKTKAKDAPPFQINEKTLAQAFQQKVDQAILQIKTDIYKQENPAPVDPKAKQPEPEVQVQYRVKGFDGLFLVQDYPQNEAEFLEISQLTLQYDILINVREKLITDNFPEEEEDEEEDDEAQKKQEKFKPDLELTELDQKHISEQNAKCEGLKSYRRSSSQQDKIRNAYVMEQIFEYDPYGEEESYKQIVEQLYADINIFNSDKQSFNKWFSQQQSRPLIQKQDDVQKDPLDAQQIQLETQITNLQEAIELVKAQRAKAKKPDESPIPEQTQLDECQENLKQIIQQKKLKAEQQQQNYLKQYKMQLKCVEDQNIGVSTLLECILDQIEYESLGNQNSDDKLKTQSDQSNKIKELIFGNNKKNSHQDEKQIQIEGVFYHQNEINLRSQNASFNNGSQLREKEVIVINID